MAARKTSQVSSGRWARGSVSGRGGARDALSSALTSSFPADVTSFLSCGRTTVRLSCLRIFGFVLFRQIDTWTDGDCSGRTEFLRTLISCTHSSRMCLSSPRVCEDPAVKGQSSRGPRVRSQGGEGETPRPSVSQRVFPGCWDSCPEAAGIQFRALAEILLAMTCLQG